MFCCVVLVVFLVFAICFFTALAMYAKQVAVGFGVLIGVYFLYYTVKSFCSLSKLTAEKTAWHIFRKSKKEGLSSGSDPLPEHLQGVFWFETNAAPELMMTMENSGVYRNESGEDFTCYNKGNPYINVNSGGANSWAHSADCIGWPYWAALRCSWICCSELHMNFQDSDMKKAGMPLYVCGGCPDSWCPQCDGCFAPMGMWWDLEMLEDTPERIEANGEGNTWDRGIYLYCCGASVTSLSCNCLKSEPVRWDLGSYSLVRIIDGEGNQLPAFDRMTTDIEQGVKVKGVYKKPNMQLVNGDDWKGNILGASCCCCCPGSSSLSLDAPLVSGD